MRAMTDRIPTLSLHDADSPAFVAALGEAYTRYGFVIIADHGIPQGLIDRFLDLYKTFFAWPARRRRSCRGRGSGR